MFRAAVLLVAVLSLVVPAHAETPAEAARSLIARYDEDLTRIDRARDLLESALTKERRIDTLITLSYVYFLVGDVRARTRDEKLAAYDRGRQIGERAVELAPRDEEAHLWFAINTGRWGQANGILRSLFLLPTVRKEIETILELNPRSVRGRGLAGNVLMEVPRIAGGDRVEAEKQFRRGLEVDPRFTSLRVDLARLLIMKKRYDDARRELTGVVDERAPTNLADWTVKDRPKARELLESLRDKM
ncbi:MAG: tetratricopeptide repeat protein [Candidatus Rokubacteria bacterium]|nr:tetratricopeptide repeat protein [Candidatus Rokubacteria bacterium]